MKIYKFQIDVSTGSIPVQPFSLILGNGLLLDNFLQGGSTDSFRNFSVQTNN